MSKICGCARENIGFCEGTLSLRLRTFECQTSFAGILHRLVEVINFKSTKFIAAYFIFYFDLICTVYHVVMYICIYALLVGAIVPSKESSLFTWQKR